jgi:hypothetical protein
MLESIKKIVGQLLLTVSYEYPLAKLNEKAFKTPTFANDLLIKTVRKSQRKNVSDILHLLTVTYTFHNSPIINSHKTVIKSLKNY